MAITVCGNCIDFGSQSICVEPAGIYVSGRFDFAGCGIAPTQAQGKVSGYISGGICQVSPGLVTSNINKFPFSSDSPSSLAGSLTQAREDIAGQSSRVSGYNSGGGYAPPIVDTIDKFPFASDGPSSDVGELTQAREGAAGQTSKVSGYTTGGAAPPGGIFSDTIDKFPFAADANATDVGEIVPSPTARCGLAGQSSRESGYLTGGCGCFGDCNRIDKFPFATDTNTTDVGDLIVARNFLTGHNSLESGYSSGGFRNPPSTRVRCIDKFPFASDTNATSVGLLIFCRQRAAGQSSTESGYTSGGYGDLAAPDTIEKFSFSSDGNATDVGELSPYPNGIQAATGQQI